MSRRRVVSLERSPGERLVAWTYTGPLGHLYSALADISVMWMAHARLRLRRSISRARRT